MLDQDLAKVPLPATLIIPQRNEIGDGPKPVTFHQVLSGIGPDYDTELGRILGLPKTETDKIVSVLKSSELSQSKYTVKGVEVNWLFPKYSRISEVLKTQLDLMIDRAKSEDPLEFEQIRKSGMEVVWLPPCDINRPFISGNRIFLPRLTEGDSRSYSSFAHEFSHLVLHQSVKMTPDVVGTSKSKTITEGAAIYLSEKTYYTKIDDPKVRASDVRLDDSSFFFGWRVRRVWASLTEKGVKSIPVSIMALNNLMEEHGLRSDINFIYLFGATLMQEVISYCDEKGLSSRESIKSLFVNSNKKEVIRKSKAISDSNLDGLGLSHDEETRIMYQALIETFGLSPEEASALIIKVSRRIFGISA